jgi:hypothetical protein
MSKKDNSREIWKEANIRAAALKKFMEMKSVIELRKKNATDVLTPRLLKQGTKGSSHSQYIPATKEGA